MSAQLDRLINFDISDESYYRAFAFRLEQHDRDVIVMVILVDQPVAIDSPPIPCSTRVPDLTDRFA